MSNSEPSAFRMPSAPNSESIRVIVVGTVKAVNNFIVAQHQLGFAETLEWSPPLQTPHANQIMRILTKRLSVEETEALP